MTDRFRGPRMSKHWHALNGGETHFVANATSLTSAFVFEADPGTVIRMLGEYVISPTAAPTVADAATLTVGIGIVSADAAELGATAMPDPSTEPEYPWMYWASHAVHYASTEVDPSSRAGSIRHSFDIRSMRKFKPREALAFVVQYEDTAGNPPLTFMAGKTRILFAQ